MAQDAHDHLHARARLGELDARALAQPMQNEISLADLAQALLDGFGQRGLVPSLAALRRQNEFRATLDLRQDGSELAMHADRELLAGLFLHDADEAVVEIAPSHVANVAATLPGIEQQREGELELVARALEEAPLHCGRPRHTRICLIRALA